MSIVLNEEQVLLKDMAKAFFTEKAPLTLHRSLREDANQGYSESLWREMVDLGWAGINVPEQFGGLEFGFRGVSLVMEEAGRTLAASPLLSTVVLGASALELGGSPEQKETLLPQVVNGMLMLALAVDEGPHHNPAATALSAEKSVRGYVLNGSKHFVIDGNVADKLIVAVRTAEATDSTDGISLLLVDSNADGVSIKPRAMVDHRNSASITFTDVTVAEDALLGEANQGGQLLEQVLDRGRVALAAEMLGSMQQTFENILSYLKERKQFGQTIGTFQALQHRAAKMFSDVEECKSIVSEAVQAIEEDRDDVPQLASMAKAMVNRAFHNASSEGIQMYGGMGMTDECDMGFYLKRARVAEQSLGTASYHEARYASALGF